MHTALNVDQSLISLRYAELFFLSKYLVKFGDQVH